MIAAIPKPSADDSCADSGWSRPAFSEIVRTEAAFVLRITRRLGVAPKDVDDVAQESFLVLHCRYADWAPGTSVRGFLFGIVRRIVANHRRKLRTREEVGPEALAELTNGSGDPHAALERERERALLERGLDALDEEKREVFVLFELEEFEMHEVAEMVGCPVKTAYSRLYAARELVRSRVLRAETTKGSK